MSEDILLQMADQLRIITDQLRTIICLLHEMKIQERDYWEAWKLANQKEN